jgi:hypothetical protein
MTYYDFIQSEVGRQPRRLTGHCPWSDWPLVVSEARCQSGCVPCSTFGVSGFRLSLQPACLPACPPAWGFRWEYALLVVGAECCAAPEQQEPLFTKQVISCRDGCTVAQ